MSDCLFCRIVERKMASEIVYENESVLAFKDIHPQAPVHVLVIPKLHMARLSEAREEHESILGALCLAANQIAERYGVEDGYRLVINNGSEAGQSVFHIHLHLLGGRRMTWPPG